MVKEANDIAGYVTAQAAAETGLAEGTPVITGTDDSGSGGGLAQTGDNTFVLVGGVALAAVALVAGGVIMRRRTSR